jgi:hypothetical protein
MTPTPAADPLAPVPAPAAVSAGSGNPIPQSLPTSEQLAHELVELEAHFPPPDEAAIRADCRWVRDNWGTTVFAPYRGTHVAVLDGVIVGHDDNVLQLGIDLARKLGVHPQRFVIVYIDPPASGLVYSPGAPGHA